MCPVGWIFCLQSSYWHVIACAANLAQIVSLMGSNCFWQYFLNPKVAKEPIPPQLELIAKDILVPLLIVFHQFVEKVVFFTLPCSFSSLGSLL